MVVLQQVYLCVNSNSQFKVLICLIKTPERSLFSRATDSAINLEFMKILHLSTYIMETRRKKKSTDVSNEEEEPKNEKLTKKSEKMRRYRSNVRSDAARLEKMRKKNRECKKVKRDLQRQAIQSENTKLEKKDQEAKKHLDEKIQR